MTAMDWFGNGQENDVAVCVTHMRFVPCRCGNAHCWISTDPIDVDDVRRYQVATS